jgi:hypothetical protein
MLKTFIERISALDENQMEKWLSDGLIAYHDDKAVTYHRAEKAFPWARLSFGRGGQHSNVVDDLNFLFAELGDHAKSTFARALARSIELLSITNSKRCAILRNLIEVALDTKNTHAINAITQKLTILDPNARHRICLEAVYFLEEGHAAPDLLDLGRTLLREIDFPYEISGRLLIGLSRLDVRNAGRYAREIQPKLMRLLDAMRKHPTQFEKFRKDFTAAVLLAPDDSTVIEELLGIHLYAELLDEDVALESSQVDSIESADTAGGSPISIFDQVRIWGAKLGENVPWKKTLSNNDENSDTAIIVPALRFESVRRWQAKLVNTCSYARYKLRCYRRNIRKCDTINAIDTVASSIQL